MPTLGELLDEEEKVGTTLGDLLDEEKARATPPKRLYPEGATREERKALAARRLGQTPEEFDQALAANQRTPEPVRLPAFGHAAEIENMVGRKETPSRFTRTTPFTEAEKETAEKLVAPMVPGSSEALLPLAEKGKAGLAAAGVVDAALYPFRYTGGAIRTGVEKFASDVAGGEPVLSPTKSRFYRGGKTTDDNRTSPVGGGETTGMGALEKHAIEMAPTGKGTIAKGTRLAVRIAGKAVDDLFVPENAVYALGGPTLGTLGTALRHGYFGAEGVAALKSGLDDIDEAVKSGDEDRITQAASSITAGLVMAMPVAKSGIRRGAAEINTARRMAPIKEAALAEARESSPNVSLVVPPEEFLGKTVKGAGFGEIRSAIRGDEMARAQSARFSRRPDPNAFGPAGTDLVEGERQFFEQGVGEAKSREKLSDITPDGSGGFLVRLPKGGAIQLVRSERAADFEKIWADNPEELVKNVAEASGGKIKLDPAAPWEAVKDKVSALDPIAPGAATFPENMSIADKDGRLIPVRAVIEITRNADKTTLAHELGHVAERLGFLTRQEYEEYAKVTKEKPGTSRFSEKVAVRSERAKAINKTLAQRLDEFAAIVTGVVPADAEGRKAKPTLDQTVASGEVLGRESKIQDFSTPEERVEAAKGQQAATVAATAEAEKARREAIAGLPFTRPTPPPDPLEGVPPEMQTLPPVPPGYRGTRSNLGPDPARLEAEEASRRAAQEAQAKAAETAAAPRPRRTWAETEPPVAPEPPRSPIAQPTEASTRRAALDYALKLGEITPAQYEAGLRGLEKLEATPDASRLASAGIPPEIAKGVVAAIKAGAKAAPKESTPTPGEAPKASMSREGLPESLQKALDVVKKQGVARPHDIAKAMTLGEKGSARLLDDLATMGFLGEKKADGTRDILFQAPTKRSKKGFGGVYDHVEELLRSTGLRPEQQKALEDAGALQVIDSVTGHHAQGLMYRVLQKAQEHVKGTGEPGVYVEADFRNLGGLNTVKGHTEADKVYRAVTDKVRERMEEIPDASVSHFRGKGGDEIPMVVVGADKAVVEAKLAELEADIQQIAKGFGVEDIEHGKKRPIRGIGLTWATSKIDPELSIDEIRHEADIVVERKKGEQGREHQGAAREARALAPRGIASAGRSPRQDAGRDSGEEGGDRGPALPGVNAGVFYQTPKGLGTPDELGFYSALERAIGKLPERVRLGELWRESRFPGKPATGLLASLGVKPEEMKWSGMADVIKAAPDKVVSRDSLAERAMASFPYVSETRQGSVATPTKSGFKRPAEYGEYVEPGGKDYGEIVLSTDVEGPAPQHFGAVPNQAAHARFNTRTGPNGEKVLFVEEIQSDWGQELRNSRPENIARLEDKVKSAEEEAGGAVTARLIGAENDLYAARNSDTAEGPFVGSTPQWTRLAIKRILKHAADNGFDRIAWTTGEMQADRYREDGVNRDTGMAGFYDNILPKEIESYGKKMGLRVETIPLDFRSRGVREVQSVAITPEAKATVSEGQPMFQAPRLSGKNRAEVERRLREAMAKEGRGDDKLSWQYREPEAREAVRARDEMTKDLRERVPDAELEAKAEAMMADEATHAARIEDRARRGLLLETPEDWVFARKHFGRRLAEDWRSNDIDRQVSAVLLEDIIRNTGSATGRLFRQMRDPIMRPAERLRSLINEAFHVQDPDLVERLRDNDPEAQAELQRRLDRVRRRYEREGINLSALTDRDLLDRSTFARYLRIAAQEKASWGDKFREFYTQGLISGLKTHAVNTTGNIVNMVWKYGLEKPIEQVLRSIPGLGTKEDARDLTEVLKLGWGNYLTLGLEFGKEAFDSEMRVLESKVTGQETLGSQRLEMPRTAIKDYVYLGGQKIPWGRAVRLPGRALGFADEVAKTAAGHLEAAFAARRIARADGLSGDALDARAKELIEDFTSAAWKEALPKAEEAVFQKKLGKFGQRLLSVREWRVGGFTPLSFLVPFVVTPYNIFRTAGHRVPIIGAFRAVRALKEGKTKGWTPQRVTNFTEAASQQIGGVIALAGLSAIVNGLNQASDEPDTIGVVGGESFRPDSRGQAESQKRLAPYSSVGIGKTRYGFGRIEPLATTVNVTKALYDFLEAGQEGAGLEEAGKTMYGALVGELKNKTFLEGIDQVIRAVEGQERLASLAVNTATGFIPNIIRQPLREMRETVPETKVWGAKEDADKGESLLARTGRRVVSRALPIADKTPSRRTVTGGEEKKRQDSLIGRLIGPMEIYTPEGYYPKELLAFDRRMLEASRRHGLSLDSGTDEGYEKQARDEDTAPKPYFAYQPYPRLTGKRGEKVFLSDEQNAKLQQVAGEKLMTILSRRRYYTGDAPLTKRDVEAYRKDVSWARRIARDTVLRDYYAEERKTATK